jgi:signal transduction histidine kinase/CheY-like chemotaxis protein/HPt (histidine-containing phosphotransfer) domain-containing protein
MNFLGKLKISTKITVGFSLILTLLLVITITGSISLFSADKFFKEYRSLARQTNAEGRVQANMLTTRLFAKNFVITASEENIKGVKERAQKTIQMISEARALSNDRVFNLMVDDLHSELIEYLGHFDTVTKKQAIRNDLVFNGLNVVGPEMERGLTAIMESAFKDGDADAAYRAGTTMRSLLLARLYAARFLVQNDTASYDRVRDEFRQMEKRIDELLENLENPKRREIAELVRSSQRDYFSVFTDVHDVITARNDIIRTQLDRIGPKVADKIEKLKLSLKEEQDKLGPKAEASIDQALVVTVTISIASILLGLIAVWFLGFGVSKPILRMVGAMTDLAGGKTNVEIPYVNRKDEIGEMAASIIVFKEGMTRVQESAEKEREAAIEIGKARDLAEEASKAKASFLAAMSHEIRTPMNGIIGMVDLLVQTKLGEDQRHMMRTVKESAYGLLTIINDILDFSKIEAGKLELEQIPVSIRDLVEGIAETLAPNANSKGIRINIHVDPEIPDALLGDSVRLRQILFNIAGNAVKFTEEGRVLIRAFKEKSRNKNDTVVRFEVIDSGIGMSKEGQENLFKEFSQAEASTTRRFGGTGLGLTICSRLTELMVGKIGVESKLGEGSTFIVTLTLPIAEKHEIKSDRRDLSGLKVMFVGEDAEERELDASYLRYSNANVTTVGDIKVTKSMLVDAAKQNVPFDIVVLGSAWSIDVRAKQIEALQTEKQLSETRFVLLTEKRLKEHDKEIENTVFVGSDPLRRGPFIRAIAVAAGRASPNISYDEEEIAGDVNKAPTIEEAEIAGTLILVAEDNLTNQDVIHRQLELLGYASEIFADGKKAFEAWKSKRYAILLTDCHMPEMDGFELTGKIRAAEKGGNSHLPIVAITASTLEAEVSRCYSAGMDDFLAKPMQMPKLKTVLRKWIPTSNLDSIIASLDVTSDKKAQSDSGSETGKATNATDNSPIDPIALTSVFGDDQDTFCEILSEFVEPATANVSEINTAFNNRSADGVAKAAHKLKSSARSVGANDLADLCQSLEAAGNAEDWNVIDKDVPQLSPTIQKVVEYIDAL